MKKTLFLLLTISAMTMFCSCENYETYGDKKDKERAAISKFLQAEEITVISEAQFKEQGCTTICDSTVNQFAYMENTGVYMQIERKGCGTPLQNGENSDLLIRFTEYNIMDSTVVYNDLSPYDPDVMNIRKEGSTLTASFTFGTMYSTYGASVPSGWLVPLNYLNVGRPRSESDEICKVNLIVPHSQGHSVASSYVYPYYYEITFERKIDIQ